MSTFFHYAIYIPIGLSFINATRHISTLLVELLYRERIFNSKYLIDAGICHHQQSDETIMPLRIITNIIKRWLQVPNNCSLLDSIKLRQFIKLGLRLPDDCSIVRAPNFGTEPYLVTIGKHVRFSAKVTLATHDGATWVFRHMPEYRDVIKYGRITIHDNCFIGFGVVILPGVSIGPNAVVGACSVVTKDVPPNSIVAGNPAKVITTLDQFAKKCHATTPQYDKEKYKSNKQQELLRIFSSP